MIQFITVANQSSSLDATCKDFKRSKDHVFSTKSVSVAMHTRYKSFAKGKLMKKLVINYITFRMNIRGKFG
jgi:hypothetical protein